ncbi:HET domain-containing protein [Aspergillus foveolatus]|uniref:HET domain-containing protein n=1 Tax=Aspergillus foveolatus TaxID=210207 RepID=UPI003CCE1427
MLVLGLGEAQLSQAKQAARHGVLLYLGVPHASKPSIPAADIYVNYGDENGVVNIWVGDLYIDDLENGIAHPLPPYSQTHFAKKVEGLTACSVGEMVSWAPLIDRINKCYETHSKCRPKTGDSLPPGFRVIDVNRRCLVETNDCRFVALSYVWGLTPKSKLLACSRATIDEMKKDGGLPPTKVPRTIEDAIAACIHIGERYLWADMLCIIQDDPEDLQTQVNAMGEIYPSATIVLVASYGNSMEFGIPGIGHPRNAVQQSADIAGLRVTNVLREADEDPFNLWPTRGWTYQEAVLSNRRLYFTSTRAFFECEQSICHEDPFNLEEIRDELLSTRLVISEDMSRFDSFKRHLRHYSTRKLTYRSDAYNALFGILKSLYKGSERIIHGLPEVDFDRALLWRGVTDMVMVFGDGSA